MCKKSHRSEKIEIPESADLYDQPLNALLDTPDQLLDATEDALDDDTLEEAPEYQDLPASRSWDQNKIDALWMDWSSPPCCNLICIHHFCPDLAGEDEPDQMEEIRLPRPGTD